MQDYDRHQIKYACGAAANRIWQFNSTPWRLVTARYIRQIRAHIRKVRGF